MDSTLDDVRRMAVDLATNILRLPETRPSDLPPAAVAAVGDLLHACDLLIGGLAGHDARDMDIAALLAGLRAHRRLLFLVLAQVAPDLAAPRTEAAQEAERESAAKMASGLLPRFSTDQAFAETLRARWLGESDT